MMSAAIRNEENLTGCRRHRPLFSDDCLECLVGEKRKRGKILKLPKSKEKVEHDDDSWHYPRKT